MKRQEIIDMEWSRSERFSSLLTALILQPQQHPVTSSSHGTQTRSFRERQMRDGKPLWMQHFCGNLIEKVIRVKITWRGCAWSSLFLPVWAHGPVPLLNTSLWCPDVPSGKGNTNHISIHYWLKVMGLGAQRAGSSGTVISLILDAALVSKTWHLAGLFLSFTFLTVSRVSGIFKIN